MTPFGLAPYTYRGWPTGVSAERVEHILGVPAHGDEPVRRASTVVVPKVLSMLTGKVPSPAAGVVGVCGVGGAADQGGEGEGGDAETKSERHKG